MSTSQLKKLLLLAKSYALDRGADRIDEEALYQALSSYRLLGDDEAAAAIWDKRVDQSTPLSWEDAAEREKRAAAAATLKLSPEAISLAEKIEQFPGRLVFKAGKDAESEEAAERSPLLARAVWARRVFSRRLVGQDAPLAGLSRYLTRRPATGGPAGVYVFAGAPAAGKTLAARALAEALETDYFTLDCSAIRSSYQESILRGDTTDISGARAGELTSYVREHPDCVVELQRFEQMSPEAHGSLLSILSEGRLKDLFGFYEEGRGPKSGKRTKAKGSSVVDFSRVHLVFEVHGCEDLYENPTLLARLRAEGGEEQVRATLIRSLARLTVRVQQHENLVFSPSLLSRLETAACFCLFSPLDSASLLNLCAQELPQALNRAAANLGLKARQPDAETLANAARLFLWGRGGAATAGAVSVDALSGLLLDPLAECLLQADNPESKPCSLEIAVPAETRKTLEDIALELGEDPVHALFRSIRRLHCELRAEIVPDRNGDAETAKTGDTEATAQEKRKESVRPASPSGQATADQGATVLRLTLETPRLVRTPSATDYQDKPGALVVDLPNTRFADVAGLDDIKERLKSHIAQVQNWRDLARQGMRAPGGMLLWGAPGTGKTFLARACAGELGLPCLETTGPQCIDPAFQDKVFRLLAKYAPALLFIDEIDALGRRGQGLDVALNALLAHMDGFSGADRPPIYVIAATNRPQDVDPALKRSGRLEAVMAVPLPDRAARSLMLSRLQDRLAAETLEALTDFAAGMSGADLHAAIREMLLTPLTPGEHLLDAASARAILQTQLYGKKITARPEARRMVAFHEAGHAVVLLYALPEEREVQHISLTFRREDAAHVYSEAPPDAFFIEDRTHILAEMAVSLAGMAAQGILAQSEAGAEGRVVDCGDGRDLEQANFLAHLAVTHGLDKEVGLRCAPGSGDCRVFEPPFRTLVDRRMRVWLAEAETLAIRLLREHWSLVQDIAQALLEREALSRAEVRDLMRAHEEEASS